MCSEEPPLLPATCSGYRGLTVADASAARLAALRAGCTDLRTLAYLQADAAAGGDLGTDRHHTYSLAVDWGWLDQLLCRPGGQEAAEGGLRRVAAASGASGRLVLLSHGTPEQRLPLLTACGWQSAEVRGGWGGSRTTRMCRAGGGGGGGDGR